MLPLVHPEGGIVRKKSTVPRVAGRCLSNFLGGKAVSGPALIPQSVSRRTCPVSFIMRSLEANSSTRLIVKQKKDTGNPCKVPVGPLDLLLIVAWQR